MRCVIGIMAWKIVRNTQTLYNVITPWTRCHGCANCWRFAVYQNNRERANCHDTSAIVVVWYVLLSCLNKEFIKLTAAPSFLWCRVQIVHSDCIYPSANPPPHLPLERLYVHPKINTGFKKCRICLRRCSGGQHKGWRVLQRKQLNSSEVEVLFRKSSA